MFIFTLLEARFRAAYLAASPFLLHLVLYPAFLSPSARLILAFFELYTTVACILALALLYKLVLYPVLLSPLSRLPQPHWSCSVSSVWILWVRFSGRENRTLHALHQKHGSVVRIGPAEVSVNSSEALKTVYQGGFDKHSWYNVFSNYVSVESPPPALLFTSRRPLVDGQATVCPIPSLPRLPSTILCEGKWSPTCTQNHTSRRLVRPRCRPMSSSTTDSCHCYKNQRLTGSRYRGSTYIHSSVLWPWTSSPHTASDCLAHPTSSRTKTTEITGWSYT